MCIPRIPDCDLKMLQSKRSLCTRFQFFHPYHVIHLTSLNLDSVLKSRDNTWATKIHLVRAMVFPIVIYGCESWTIKKAVY